MVSENIKYLKYFLYTCKDVTLKIRLIDSYFIIEAIIVPSIFITCNERVGYLNKTLQGTETDFITIPGHGTFMDGLSLEINSDYSVSEWVPTFNTLFVYKDNTPIRNFHICHSRYSEYIYMNRVKLW